ncbi:MAG: EamA family transporter [Pseudomonadales bacterium]|nr:EamA family transporter [Pseudomonadales bacterium]
MFATRTAKLALCLAIVYLVWGSSYLVTAVGVKHLPPLLFGGVRFSIAGLLLTTLARLRGQSVRLDRVEWRHLTFVALGSILLSNGTNTWGLQYVASSQAALLNTTAALWIAIFATRGPRAHPLDARTTVGLAIGFLGAALIIWPRGSQLTSGLPQQGVILIGVLGWAFAAVYLRNVVSKLDVLAFTGMQFLLGGAMLIVAGLALGEAPRFKLTVAGLWPMAYLTLVSSCIAYLAFAWLAKNTTPAVAGTYAYVNPAIAAVVGWAILDERLTGTQIIGMAIMLAGIAIISWQSKRRRLAPLP